MARTRSTRISAAGTVGIQQYIHLFRLSNLNVFNYTRCPWFCSAGERNLKSTINLPGIVSRVANMDRTFCGATNFNGNIGNWDGESGQWIE